jgi:hypothetical protein
MNFELVTSSGSYGYWKCGLYSIHRFSYSYKDERQCTRDLVEQPGFWAYYDSKRILGKSNWQGFDTLQEAITACDNHAERN